MTARAPDSISVPGFHWCPTAMRESCAPTKHVLRVFQCIPGYGDKVLERKHPMLAVILLSRKTQPEFWPPECRRRSDGVSGTCEDCSLSVALAHQKIFQKQFSGRSAFHPRFLQDKQSKKLSGAKSKCQKPQKKYLPLKVPNRWGKQLYTCSQYVKYNLLYLGHS